MGKVQCNLRTGRSSLRHRKRNLALSSPDDADAAAAAAAAADTRMMMAMMMTLEGDDDDEAFSRPALEVLLKRSKKQFLQAGDLQDGGGRSWHGPYRIS